MAKKPPARKKQAAAKKKSLTKAKAGPRQTTRQRVAAITATPTAACENDKSLQNMLRILRDKGEKIEVRLAALQSLQAAAFSVVAFENCRSEYIAALREVATDEDPELRQRVLGMLAREKDGFAQRTLLAGLKDPEKALVPPEKALQLLSYDLHTDGYAVAREIVKRPPNVEAKREALRLLAADTTAAPVFEKILRDKDEMAELRQLSASALHALKPAKLQENARELLLDQTEYPEIQATSLTALTNFGDAEAINSDRPLMERVEEMRGSGGSKLKQSARQFLDKYNA